MRAEAEGFEPPDPFEPSVFKTDAFDHSATPPAIGLGTIPLSEFGQGLPCTVEEPPAR